MVSDGKDSKAWSSTVIVAEGSLLAGRINSTASFAFAFLSEIASAYGDTAVDGLL